MAKGTSPPVCLDCGVPLVHVPGRQGAWPKRCSGCRVISNRRREAQRVRPSKRKPPEPPRTCLDCPALVYKALASWPLRCPECKKMHVNAQRRARKAQRRELDRTLHPTRPCDDCGVETPRGAYWTKVHRCPPCRASHLASGARRRREEGSEAFLAAEARWRAKNPDKLRSKNWRKRALRREATIEEFDHREVFERDKWRCQVCRHKISPKTKWPHPRSASLDHIIPLSERGPHSRANTRLVCFACNVSRGNRGGNEQLMLIG